MARESLEQTTFAALISEGSLEVGDGYRAKNDELGGDGLIFLRAGHVTDSHIDFSGVDRFRSELSQRVQSKLAKAGDAVVTTKGNSTGRATFVTSSMPPFVYSPHLSYWRSKNPNRIDSGFLRYWSKGPEFVGQLAGMKMSTDMAPYLSLIDQRRLRITLPPIEQQRSLAQVLGALDDRIDNLRQTNATLEAIAATLFKSWFVDFDGVAAEDMQESELGLIPKGWRVGALADSVEFKEGPGIRNWQYTNSDEGVKFINIRCIQNGDLYLETANRITDEEAHGKYSHFLLQPWDIVVSTSGTLGRSAIVREQHLPLVLNTSVIRFRPIKDVTEFSYLYQYLNGDEFLEKLESMASGSVQKNFGPMHLKQIKMLLPPIERIRHFEEVCRPIYEQILGYRSQAATLATLRDTLLPRLISGCLRIGDAERSLAAA